MKTLMITLIVMLSINVFGQKAYFSENFLELKGKEISGISKIKKIDKYRVKKAWILNDLDNESAVIRLKHKNENLIIYATVKRDENDNMYCVIDDIAKVYLDKNEVISICVINGGQEIVGVFRTEKNEISKLKKVWQFDNKEKSLEDFELGEIETLDEMHQLI